MFYMLLQNVHLCYVAVFYDSGLQYNQCRYVQNTLDSHRKVSKRHKSFLLRYCSFCIYSQKFINTLNIRTKQEPKFQKKFRRLLQSKQMKCGFRSKRQFTIFLAKLKARCSHFNGSIEIKRV